MRRGWIDASVRGQLPASPRRLRRTDCLEPLQTLTQASPALHPRPPTSALRSESRFVSRAPPLVHRPESDRVSFGPRAQAAASTSTGHLPARQRRQTMATSAAALQLTRQLHGQSAPRREPTRPPERGPGAADGSHTILRVNAPWLTRSAPVNRRPAQTPGGRLLGRTRRR